MTSRNMLDSDKRSDNLKKQLTVYKILNIN